MKHSAIVGRIFFHMSRMALSEQSCPGADSASQSDRKIFEI